MKNYMTNPEFDEYCKQRETFWRGVLVGVAGASVVFCSALCLWPWP